jgi:CRISPR-associated protein Csb1
MPMPADLETLKSIPRILIEAALKPVAGTRIQPTGFPDLGPADYKDANDIPTLLVESAQSMANRLEAVCWDEGANDIAPELKGLPFVLVKLAGLGDGSDTTTSLQEFHRLNSPYIMTGKTADGVAFADVLKPQLGLVSVAARQPANRRARPAAEPTTEEPTATEKEPDDVAGVVNLRKLATVCFKYDPNSLVHGIFLEKIAGRLRHPRALSAFIEATGVGRADSGGVKFDRAMPKPLKGLDAKTGYGNVPFHRTEFTAKAITAYFSLDLSQIRGYGLSADATSLLELLSLWKVRKFLDSNMRLRSACELELVDGAESIIIRKRPDGFTLRSANELAGDLKTLIGKCKPLFADPTVTELVWTAPKAKE